MLSRIIYEDLAESCQVMYLNTLRKIGNWHLRLAGYWQPFFKRQALKLHCPLGTLICYFESSYIEAEL